MSQEFCSTAHFKFLTYGYWLKTINLRNDYNPLSLHKYFLANFELIT